MHTQFDAAISSLLVRIENTNNQNSVGDIDVLSGALDAVTTARIKYFGEEVHEVVDDPITTAIDVLKQIQEATVVIEEELTEA